jgi:hypothetical protein
MVSSFMSCESFTPDLEFHQGPKTKYGRKKQKECQDVFTTSERMPACVVQEGVFALMRMNFSKLENQHQFSHF